MCLFKLQNVFAQIARCICSNCKMYLFKLTDAFDKIKIKHLQWWIVATLLKAAALLLQQKGQTPNIYIFENFTTKYFPSWQHRERRCPCSKTWYPGQGVIACLSIRTHSHSVKTNSTKRWKREQLLLALTGVSPQKGQHQVNLWWNQRGQLG